LNGDAKRSAQHLIDVLRLATVCDWAVIGVDLCGGAFDVDLEIRPDLAINIAWVDGHFILAVDAGERDTARAPFVGRRLADVIEEFDYYVGSLFRPAIKGGA
jgi:hypothetical protein